MTWRERKCHDWSHFDQVEDLRDKVLRAADDWNDRLPGTTWREVGRVLGTADVARMLKNSTFGGGPTHKEELKHQHPIGVEVGWDGSCLARRPPGRLHRRGPVRRAPWDGRGGRPQDDRSAWEPSRPLTTCSDSQLDHQRLGPLRADRSHGVSRSLRDRLRPRAVRAPD